MAARLLYHEVIAEAGDVGAVAGVRARSGRKHTDLEVPDRRLSSPHYRLLLIDLRDHGYSKDISAGISRVRF